MEKLFSLFLLVGYYAIIYLLLKFFIKKVAMLGPLKTKEKYTGDFIISMYRANYAIIVSAAFALSTVVLYGLLNKLIS